MSLTPEQLTNLSAQEKRELLKKLLEQKKTNQPKTYPLSFAQERLWFLEQFEPGSAVYNIPRAVRLRGLLDVGALQQAVNSLVARHETLRTTFATVDGVPTQVVATEDSIYIEQVVLRGADGEDSAVFLPYLLAESTKPFNLATGPLLRLQLLRFSPTDHILLLTMHHIISDGWSMSVLTRELAHLYNRQQLAPLGLQYGRFAQQQRQHLQGTTLETLISYWRTALTGAPPLLQLPTDHPRPALQTFDGATFNVVLPTALTHSLKTFCQQQGVTLFAALLAAFKTLLYRYTGQPDLCVGTPAANRNRRDVEEIIGIFVNTLVLRTVLLPEWTFNDVLQRVRQTVLEALAHQEMPFEQLVEVLQPERSLSHHPLFQVMFILQNAPESDIHLPGLTMTPLEVDNGTAKFDLTVSVRETADSLTATFEYNTHLFERETIQRMAGHYQVLLQAALVSPTQPILQLPLLMAQEQHQLLVEWNETTAVFPPVCIHHLFEAQVEKTPDKKAAVFGTQSLTYRQLDDRANQVAHNLQAQGIGLESLVGVQMQRSLDMLVAVLGILKAGAAYVPLDPAFPTDRLAFMVQDANLALILVSSPSVYRKERKEEKEASRLTLDELVPPTIHYPLSTISPPVTPQNLAYVIYTSGSTGKPKGVQVTHRGVVNFLHSMSQQPGLAADDVLFAITTLSFDIAGLELFLPLCAGAQVVIASRQQQTDGKQLLAALAESGATVMQATPATWQLLLETGWQEPRLHKILCGGEALSRSLADRLLDQADEVWNLYGPTETTIWSTCKRVEKGRGEETAVSIGRPIANTQIYILDGQMQPVPIGVTGDLYIGGAGLARGYLNRPELTAERFVSVLSIQYSVFSTQYSVLSTQYSVFSELSTDNWSLSTDNWSLGTVYRTGDVARYRLNGEIEFLGRSDFQVKVRGFRIELGEIEAALRKNTAVSDAVVVVRQDVPDDKQLVAYLLKQAELLPTPSELRLFLQKSLPDYMIPAVFVWLEAYPLTPNGKVNRLALPAVQTAELPTRFQPPRDLVELHLAQIWETLLNRQPIGVHDNFFELGGHSLLAMRLMAQIEKKFGRFLPLTTLFQNQTIEQLASHLKKHQPELAPRSSLLIPLTASGSSTPFFLIHPVGGTVFCYIELAKLLGVERPILGIAADEQNPIPDIPTLAERYLIAVRQQQPDGPYYLGGWSLGGLIAFEMARQLGEQQVAFLALIDANPIPNPHSPLANPPLLTRFLTELHGGPLADETAVLQHLHALTEDKQLEYIVEQARGMGLLPPDAGVERIRPLITLFRANLQALHTYQPGVYGGNLHFFPAHPTPEDSWQPFTAQPVTVHASPGTHFTLLKQPHVQRLAEILRSYL